MIQATKYPTITLNSGIPKLPTNSIIFSLEINLKTEIIIEAVKAILIIREAILIEKFLSNHPFICNTYPKLIMMTIVAILEKISPNILILQFLSTVTILCFSCTCQHSIKYKKSRKIC